MTTGKVRTRGQLTSIMRKRTCDSHRGILQPGQGLSIRRRPAIPIGELLFLLGPCKRPSKNGLVLWSTLREARCNAQIWRSRKHTTAISESRERSAGSVKRNPKSVSHWACGRGYGRRQDSGRPWPVYEKMRPLMRGGASSSATGLADVACGKDVLKDGTRDIGQGYCER